MRIAAIVCFLLLLSAIAVFTFKSRAADSEPPKPQIVEHRATLRVLFVRAASENGSYCLPPSYSVELADKRQLFLNGMQLLSQADSTKECVVSVLETGKAPEVLSVSQNGKILWSKSEPQPKDPQ